MSYQVRAQGLDPKDVERLQAEAGYSRAVPTHDPSCFAAEWESLTAAFLFVFSHQAALGESYTVKQCGTVATGPVTVGDYRDLFAVSLRPVTPKDD